MVYEDTFDGERLEECERVHARCRAWGAREPVVGGICKEYKKEVSGSSTEEYNETRTHMMPLWLYFVDFKICDFKTAIFNFLKLLQYKYGLKM